MNEESTIADTPPGESFLKHTELMPAPPQANHAHTMNQPPVIDPLTRPGITRILLSEPASRHLDAVGSKAFAIVCRDVWPGDPKRWIITLVPVTWETAKDADAVLFGRMAATRIRKPATPPDRRSAGHPLADGVKSHPTQP